MTDEQHMPARIWAGDDEFSTWHDDKCHGGVEFIRADLAERMAEALRELQSVLLAEYGHKGGLSESSRKCACEIARSALSAFKAGQSEAGHG